ncbi:MAG: DHA2 family efflux MFS transporter permease subunit [Stenotrophobium sp.]
MTSAPPRSRLLIPLIVACAFFMENFDSTVIATALPVMAHDLGESPLRLSLAITSYLLSLAVFIPLSGWAADRYGARRVFRSAIVLFTVGSVLCGVSQNMLELVGARVLQGIGGAMMVPVGRLVLLRNVPKSELVAAMAYVTIPALMAPVFGPPIGGFIATYSSWRWIFFINVPISIVGFWLVTKYIAETRAQETQTLDLRGWMLIGLGLAGLIFGFENLGKGVLPNAAVLAMFGTGALLVTLYVLYARRKTHPILDLSLLRLPTFGAATWGGSLFRIGTGASTLLLPLMFQLGFGMTPLGSGLLTFATAAGALLMKTAAAPLVRRYGFRRLLLGNALICGLLLAGCGLFRADTPHALILGFLLVTGFFRSLQFTCFGAMSFSDVSEARMSQATSLSGTAQQLSLSIGVGVSAQLLHLGMEVRRESVLSALDFNAAFFAVGLVMASSALIFLRLRPDAGSSVSGHGASPATS